MHQRNSSDMASAPTGCSASLIEGSTHCRCCSIPTGRDFHRSPVDIKSTHLDSIRSMRKQMRDVISRFMDEHSMAGRPYWAWLKHRHEELRQPKVVLDWEENILFREDSMVSPILHNRPHGGIPFIYSFGDCAQLPPVLMKSMYDQSRAKVGTPDAAGRVAVAEFMKSNNNSSISSTIYMDEVLRQNDPDFLQFLNNMRNGTLEENDVQFVYSRCLDKLSPTKKLLFSNNTIDLVLQ